MRPYDRLEIYDNDLGFRCLFVWEQRVVFLFRCAFSVVFSVCPSRSIRGFQANNFATFIAFN